ncbi:MAG: AMP-binding protein [Oceanospirillaceae bacterium]
MNSFFSPQETQFNVEREASLLARLAPFIAYSQQHSPYYTSVLEGVDASAITTREQLAKLPITRKSALITLQSKQSPFAGISATQAKIDRMYQSPGPINEPENCTDNWWRLGQAFYAAGFRAGDKVQNCLSYHLTPGGFILDSGARACGCTVIPAGPGQTDQQLDVIENLQPEGYCGTPSFLKILLDKAQANNRDVSSITKALVTGEAYFPALRAEFKAAGILALQAYATADIGLIAFESDPHEGLIIAEDILVEIVRPGSIEPVAIGEIGEVVVTSFNKEYPLIRFATGDLSAMLAGTSQCGRTNDRIKGWMGRADQTTKIKGMFVHPEQVEKIRLAHPQIIKTRLVVAQQNHNDVMQLHCEVEQAQLVQAQLDVLQSSITKTLKAITKLNGNVEIVAVGQLANDGKVIDDQRTL